MGVLFIDHSLNENLHFSYFFRENGYPTTEEEKVKNDDYERRAGEGMLKMILKDIRFEEREEVKKHEEEQRRNQQE